MDILNILETFGIPVTMTIAFGYFIWKQNNWIQNELSSDLDEKHKRLEGIVVKLIDAQKIMQLQQQDIKSSYQTIVEIIGAKFIKQLVIRDVVDNGTKETTAQSKKVDRPKVDN
jgi:hypothetical protein|tara:strand:- start:1218 stop:1559 length:342 start_codon:yes stop_codon:yes gene_type:complete